jgi:hypothetical protein
LKRTALIGAAIIAVGVAGTAGAAKLITGAQIKNGSIGLADLSKSAKRALKGATGPAGSTGPTGATGPAGPSATSALTTVKGQIFLAPSGDAGAAIATCPAGSHAVSGGGEALTGDGNGLAVSEMSDDHQSWITVVGNTAIDDGSIQAIVSCAAANTAVAARRTQPSAAALRQLAALKHRVAARIH